MGFGRDFFINTFKEGYEDGEQVKDTPEDSVPEVEVEETEVKSTEVKTEEVVEPEVKTYDIDGVQYTADEIKEWKQNGLRQSDYTKKTQELASQRRQLEEMGTSIPNQSEANTDTDRIARLERDLATKELDDTISALKVKYPDFDEIKVLTEAQNRKLYSNEDLDFVYRATREESKSAPIDMEAFKAQSIAEYKAQIATEKQKNKEATEGSIISSTPAKVEVDYESSLGDAEKEFCRKRGWTYKQYVEDKNAVY